MLSQSSDHRNIGMPQQRVEERRGIGSVEGDNESFVPRSYLPHLALTRPDINLASSRRRLTSSVQVGSTRSM